MVVSSRTNVAIPTGIQPETLYCELYLVPGVTGCQCSGSVLVLNDMLEISHVSVIAVYLKVAEM